MPDHPTEQVDRVVEALVNADKPAWRDTSAWYRAMARAALDAATPEIEQLRDLHKPRWENCINACCSGEQCKHRSQVCEHDYDEWPCDTAKLIYAQVWFCWGA